MTTDSGDAHHPLNFKLDIEGIMINLSDLFKKANFSHLSLNNDDSQNYLNKFNEHVPASVNGIFQNLTTSEKITIKAYSTSSESINSMLYGE